jgi:hypothetical protein
MRPLNRPMFRYGGPIKEGIMSGMQDRPGYSEAGRVGQYFSNLGKKSLNLINPLKKIPGAKQVLQSQFVKGLRTRADTPVLGGPGKFFDAGIPFTTRIRNLFPTFKFMQPKTPSGMNLGFRGTRRPIGSTYQTAPLTIKEAITSPRVIGQAIRENPITAFVGAGQIKNIPEILEGAYDVGTGTIKAGTNYLLGGLSPFAEGKQKDVELEEGTMTRGTGGPKNIGEISTDTDKKVKADGEKQQINEDRINETKQKYYKLMGIDKMNKDAVYDSLIDASRIVSEEGADLKGSIKSGSLQNRLIQAIGKNLDKSADLKKAIDSAVLKGEIQKDINLTKPSAFAEQVQYLRDNPNDPLARKLSGLTSVADNVAVIASEGKTLTSDIVGRLVGAKGQDVEGVIKDDKYQKWEKNNEGKDEIDYLQDVYKGKKLDEGIYIINKKAFQIDAKGEVNPIDLDSIIG